jgi:hypothetical protein
MKPTMNLINRGCLRVPLYHANAAGEMAEVRLSRG